MNNKRESVVQRPVVAHRKTPAERIAAFNKTSTGTEPKTVTEVPVKKTVVTRQDNKKTWKEAYGIRDEEILEMDRMVRSQRFKPSDNSKERIEYVLTTAQNESDYSSREMAEYLVRIGVKSIWLRPSSTVKRGVPFYGTQESYVDALGTTTLEAAIARLPNDDVPSRLKKIKQ